MMVWLTARAGALEHLSKSCGKDPSNKVFFPLLPQIITVGNSMDMHLYKYRSFENLEFLLDILINERLYCSEYKNLNDPFEGTFLAIQPNPIYFMAGKAIAGQPLVKTHEIKKVDDLIISATKKRVCSLSRSNSDVRLWSIYASSLAGVSIEIDFTKHKSDVHKVNYLPTLPEFGDTLLTAPNEVEILTNKTDHWQYEEEFRIITESEYYSIEGRISRILIGQRVTDEQIKIINKLTKSNIPIVRTKLDYNSIKISS